MASILRVINSPRKVASQYHSDLLLFPLSDDRLKAVGSGEGPRALVTTVKSTRVGD